MGVPAAQHDALESICTSPSVWSESGCPKTGALGGCQQVAAGISATMWFYSDATNGISSTAEVMAQCATAQQSFVSP